jgi:AraC-like DNA-binding protein
MSQLSGEVFKNHRLISATDLDAARGALSEQYLPVELRPTGDSPALDLRLNVVKVGAITAGYLRFGDAMSVRTAEARNYHIDVPLAGAAIMRSGLSDPVYSTTATGAIFMPGRPADLDCDPDCAQLCLMLPSAGLHLELENLLGHSVGPRLEFSMAMDLTTSPGRAFIQTLRLADLATGKEAGLLSHPRAMRSLEQILILNLLLSQPHNYSDQLAATPTAVGPRPVAQAVDLLRAHPEWPWTVTELARTVQVSVRSLQEGFRNSLGDTPMAYLRRTRLERAHDDLARAQVGTVTVSDVAARWGFIHLGRFAIEYQRRFAKRPSETLRTPRSE